MMRGKWVGWATRSVSILTTVFRKARTSLVGKAQRPAGHSEQVQAAGSRTASGQVRNQLLLLVGNVQPGGNLQRPHTEGN